MIKLSKNKKILKDAEKLKAAKFYHSNFTLREVAKIMGRSHEWVRTAIQMFPKNTYGL